MTIVKCTCCGGKVSHECQEVTCNKCGKSCAVQVGKIMENYGAMNVTFSSGYYSPKLPDGNTYAFSMCENCLDDLMNVFVVPAKINQYC